MRGLPHESVGGARAKGGWRLALLAFFSLLHRPSAQGSGGTTLWADVCTDEEYNNYQLELCPEIFRSSTLAFNPLYPGADANITLILQPTINLVSRPERVQYVSIRLPGFDPIGSVNFNDALIRDLSVQANNPTGIGENTATAYNTYMNPVFESPGAYQLADGTLKLKVFTGQTIRADKYTELIICCFKLPMQSPMDNTAFRISAPTSLGYQSSPILDEGIKQSPEIDPGFQWDFLMVQFHPPLARALTKIDLTLRSANDLSDRCRIILHLPGITRVPEGNADIGFSTASSGNPNDWMFFAYLARWDQLARTITFFLRDGKVLPAYKQITVSTTPGEFRLPTEIESNWDGIKTEARSSDGVDEIIRATPVSQSSHVPHVRFFEFSSLVYHTNIPGMKSEVDLNFRSNRPMFAGTTIYMRLSGFQAEVIEVPLKGILKVHFFNQVAKMHLPENILELNVNKTLYSNEFTAAITFVDLIIPPALYVNDTSLLIWNSDPDCPRQPIDMSPMVGNGAKTFILSKMQFAPMEPRRAANITILLRPSIVFFQGDSIALHLYGFFAFQTELALTGADAYRIKGSKALWHAQDHILILEVAQNQIISNSRTFSVSIARELNFRIPDKLSKNDGILRIEGRGALIKKEPIKKSPMIGDPKYVIDSRIEFEAVDAAARAIARITFTLILNCDVLPNSTIIITMGGILRHPPSCHSVGVDYCPFRSGPVALSGKNAPLFVGGVGQWSQEDVRLVVQVIPTVQIFSGEFIRFFLERDTYFMLPFAAYQNDPSFRLEVPEAGVPEQPFNFSTKINQVPKSFDESEIFYGDRGSPALPNSGAIITFRFAPNVDLPEISVVRFTLPGFTSPGVYLPLESVEVPQRGELYVAEFIRSAHWRQLQYTLDLEVPPRYTIYRETMSVFRIRGFRLPPDPLLPNDPKLTIAVIRNQIIVEEPIKISPRVVDRTFLISEFIYMPPQQQSIFLLMMRLQPTVNITEDQTITISLPGFRNSLAKRNVHIMGESRHYIRDSMGEWNATTMVLTIEVAFGMQIPAFEMVQLQIEESQGFILPASLDANDTRITIASRRNIDTQAIRKSPMVGNGPYTAHRFCMYQYEHGVRSGTPICNAAVDCSPPLVDPCSQAELERCGCETRLDHIWPIKVQGFNLQQSDALSFLRLDQLCGYADPGPSVLSTFSVPTHKSVNADRSIVEYHNIQAIDTGYFRLCVNHDGKMFDIGILVVRPACQNAMVMLGGTCVEHCPKTKIPIAGQCRRDPEALRHEDDQDLMIPVRMADPATSGGSLVDKPSDDPEVRYFIYRYTYELARLLDCDPQRILVSSLTKGSLIVNTVFKTVGDEAAQAASTERSPLGLIVLLRALQSDQSSTLYASEFFKYIDRTYRPTPLPVLMCPDSVYRVFCPYTGAILSTGLSILIFFAIVLLFFVLVVLFFAALWSIDRDRPSLYDEDLLDKIRRDPKLVEPPLQAEYAKSWLDGRFMGEEWEKARKVKMLSIKN